MIGPSFVEVVCEVLGGQESAPTLARASGCALHLATPLLAAPRHLDACRRRALAQADSARQLQSSASRGARARVVRRCGCRGAAHRLRRARAAARFRLG